VIVRRLGSLLLLLALLAALALPVRAAGLDRNFAGSAQVDYHFVPAENVGSGARSLLFDGTTVELSMKLAVDFSDHLSANVKVCVGCHGFETDMVHLDYRLVDELAVRAGRFSPSFGGFNLRHDPANQRLSDKPLPYDMGRMLRMRDWNFGVLPSPFPDNGAEIYGTHWFGDRAQLDYAVHMVSGLKGDSTGADLDFVQSRSGSLYYVDNNGRPSVGGRTSLTARLGGTSDATLGGSGMWGTFDPDNKLHYLILGGDLTFRIQRTNLRLEYLLRRQEVDVSDPTRFKYQVPAQGGDFFVKHGAYVELEQPVSPRVDLIGRVDGLYRIGNVLAGSTLSARSAVIRYTAGTAIAIDRGFRLKLSAELWSFSDRGTEGRHDEMSFHTGVVGSF
jgi:hypothetical protein